MIQRKLPQVETTAPQAAAGSEPGKDQAKPAPVVPPESTAIHSGVFRATVSVVRIEKSAADAVLQAVPGDEVRITYQDQNRDRTLKKVT